MAKQHVQFVAFNRGMVSKYGLARVDIQQLRLAATDQTNWMPRVLGSMMLRPGWGYLGYGTLGNNVAVPIPFIRATDDTCIIEVTTGNTRFNVNGTFVTRVAVATAVTNGGFVGSLAGWTVADQAGALSAWEAPHNLGQSGTGLNDAITYQEVAVAGGDQPKEHALRIVVTRGPVGLRIGTALGADDLQEETYLGVGTHSISFTPNAANFFIYFFNRKTHHASIGQCTIEPAGQLILPNPWNTANGTLLRWTQSADVLYVTDGQQAPYQIERRAPTAWSIVKYRPTDGPFMAPNFAPTTITPSDIDGDITLTASSPTFSPEHVGALWKLSSLGQSTDNVLGGLGQATSPAIRVTGVGSGRGFSFNTIPDGSWAGQLKLQVGQSADGPWTNLGVVPVPTNDFTHNDGDDNQILYYRIIVSLYSAGTVEVQMDYGGGSIDGYVRILGYTNPETVSAEVLSSLGNTGPTTIWYEGAWSVYRGWPTSNELHEDRLWWFGLGQFWGSIVDTYNSFDDTVVGDSGPINRTIGKGPVDYVNWGLSLLRLIAATDGTLTSARSDSLDTPLTPTNFNLKFPVTQGAARLAPVSTDDRGYFVHRNLVRIYELAFDTSNYIKLDYGADDMTMLNQEICEPGVAKIVVQRQPDTRIHAILTNGTVAVMVRDSVEDIRAWIKLTTINGFVEDAVVLPSPNFEDTVIYIVRRVVNGVTVRYYEQHALETECVGGTLNKQADSFLTYTGAPTNVLSAPHLVGQQVVVWGDGKDLSPGAFNSQKTYLVDNAGHITLDAGVTVSNAVFGLPYSALFVGAKLAYGAQLGSALTQRKKINRLGLVMTDTHAQGIYYGDLAGGESAQGTYGPMNPLPQIEDGAEVPYDQIWSEYDKDSFSLDGEWSPDSRLRMQAFAPRPCRVLAAVVDMDLEEG